MKLMANIDAQENDRMLSPVSEAGSPETLEKNLTVCGSGRGNYRYCSPIDYHRTAIHQSMDTALAELQAAAMSNAAVKKGRVKHRVRSMSMSMCNDSSCGYVEDCHIAPLMCSSDAESVGRGESNSKKSTRNPLRQISNILGCFSSARRDVIIDHEQKRTSCHKKTHSLALLELSQRQQTALAVKQDTIELLEWKLEQLQQQCSSSTKDSSESAKRDKDVDYPQVQSLASSLIAAAAAAGGVLKPIYSATADRHTSWIGEGEPTKCPPVIHPSFLSGLRRSLNNSMDDTAAVPQLFETAAVKARLAVRYLCKVFMKQMEVSGYSVFRTLAEIEPDTKIMNKEHSAFLLESRLNKALYHSFENDSFDETGLTRIIDPERRCAVRFADFQRLRLLEAANAVNTQHKDYDPDFALFSESKMREMWFLFPWNVVFKDSEERSSFTAAFLDAAKCIWLLHLLAFSVDPQVAILRVGKGMDANSHYVEQVAPIDDGCRRCDGPKVEFMSMPGFQIRKKIIKCQVYRHLQCKR